MKRSSVLIIVVVVIVVVVVIGVAHFTLAERRTECLKRSNGVASPKKHNQTRIMRCPKEIKNQMKIALYSCNFGNYRNEMKNYSTMTYDSKIDYWLFTDNLNFQLHPWRVCRISLLPSDDTMDGSRWTSKYVKFVLPKVLQAYDIIIWMDSKVAPIITFAKLQNLWKQYKNTEIFNLKHHIRKTPQEELKMTISMGIENITPGTHFLQMINHMKFDFGLPDTSIIIRKNTAAVNAAFAYCFELMQTYKLKRDQNVYNYALHMKKIVPTMLSTI